MAVSKRISKRAALGVRVLFCIHCSENDKRISRTHAFAVGLWSAAINMTNGCVQRLSTDEFE